MRTGQYGTCCPNTVTSKPSRPGCLFYKWVPLNHQSYTLALGLRCALDCAERIVHKYCRQEILVSLDPDIRPSVSYETDIVWTFDNLLGAMYLQMCWLMARSDERRVGKESRSRWSTYP